MKALAGTGELIRVVARRDRILLAIWVVGVALVPMGLAASAEELYPTARALRAYAQESMSNPAILGMLGPVYAPTLGGLTAWRVGVMGMLFGGLPSLLLVIRHTRAEEEAGRRELLGGGVVGRQAPLTAALVVTLAANLVLAALVAVGLMAIPSLDAL